MGEIYPQGPQSSQSREGQITALNSYLRVLRVNKIFFGDVFVTNVTAFESYFVTFVPFVVTLSRKNRRHDFVQATLHLRVVGDAPGHRHVAGAPRRDAFFDQPAGVDQHPRARAFLEPMLAQIADFVAEFGQLRRNVSSTPDSCAMIFASRSWSATENPARRSAVACYA